ncbi:DUF2946 domain-containing protein [Pseudomonas sp. MTM4]|nr:DUF2946 domain-containing protein [Stutzerimonas stutzeri]MBC8650265.1 DUF2946 domain-containing protein [Pseudomonas sp. MT4]QXY93699.1 DUF2946 domain-containing protein [Pseudomonas sp. MTM4]
MSQPLRQTERAIIRYRFSRARALLTKDLPVTRKRLSTSSIWLGLFAMLMIHVGPLYSAIQTAQTAAAPIGEHHQHAGHESSPAHGHHRQALGTEPAWLAALELCGYCELLTLNPPLTLALDLALPRHEPEHFLSLPDAPLIPALRRSSGYARAPPFFHS